MGCNLSSSSAAAFNVDSIASSVASSFGTYTEETAYAEIQQLSSSFPRAKLESPNVVVMEGKGFVFNSAPPLDTVNALKGRISVDDFIAAVNAVNRAIARAMDGQARAVRSADLPRRRSLCKEAAQAAVAKLNKCDVNNGYCWELVTGETHEHVTDVTGQGSGSTSYGVSSKKVSWVSCRLCIVFASTTAIPPALPVAEVAKGGYSYGSGGCGSVAEALALLSRMHVAGELTDAEFAEAKLRTLANKGVSQAA